MLKERGGVSNVQFPELNRRPRVLTAGALAVAFSLGMLTSTLWARHPKIVAAQGHLVKASQELEHAMGEFGGHRLKAIEHIRAAMRECDEALMVNP